MFLKPITVKSNTKIKSSERKRLLTTVSSTFDIDAPRSSVFDSDAVFRVKVGLAIGGQATVYIFANRPLLIEHEQHLIPTVYLLWNFPNIIPHFVTHDEVTSKLMSGAALMLPGIVLPKPTTLASYGKLEKNALCCIKTQSNCAAIAVGYTALSSFDMYMSGGHGKAVTMFHVLGDHICSLGDSLVRPLIPWTAEVDHADHQSDPTKSHSSTKLESVLSADDSSFVDTVDHEAEVQKESDNMQPSVDGALGFERLLRELFLRALTEISDDKLPMPLNIFYANHVLPLKPTFVPFDIKKTQYKKVGVYSKILENEGLVKMDQPSPGVFLLQSVSRDHPSFVRDVIPELEGRLRELKAPGKANNWPPGYSGPPTVEESRTITGPMVPVFSSVGHRSGEAITQPEARKALMEYVRKNNLQLTADPKKLRLDNLLAKVLEPDAYSEAPESTLAEPIYQTTNEKLVSAGLKKLPVVYRITYPAGADGQSNVLVWRNKQPPAVNLSMVKRSGKKVTRVDNLATFNIDPVQFAKLLQSTLACSAGQMEDETGGLVVQAQGNHLVAISAILTGTYELSRKYIKGFEEPSRKKKK